MIEYIKYHPQFEKQCEKLKKSNDKAIKAVENALKILSAFKSSRKDFNSMGALTHSGELRLKDGIKYRLGNGYRLVLSVREDCLFALCIGSHDQCDKWLERNRGVEEFSFSRQERILLKRMKKDQDGNQISSLSYRSSDGVIQIEDKILRQIFPGICNFPG